jgi:hypothetical protein
MEEANGNAGGRDGRQRINRSKIWKKVAVTGGEYFHSLFAPGFFRAV